MGFPVGYSELVAPRLLLHVFFFLSYVRRIIFWAFNAVGLGDLLDSDVLWPENHFYEPSLDHVHHGRELSHHGRWFRSMSTTMIQEVLPVVRYSELMAEAGGRVGDSCVVCLHEFEADEEVQRLGNCRHVFHRGCLDRWVEHDQQTCPLCRTLLVPEEMRHALGCQGWTSSDVSDYDVDLFYSSSPFSFDPSPQPSVPSQALLIPHQLYTVSSS